MALCASRDIEVALLGLFDDDLTLKNSFQKNSISYSIALNDIISTLVNDFKKVDDLLRYNYGNLIQR